LQNGFGYRYLLNAPNAPNAPYTSRYTEPSNQSKNMSDADRDKWDRRYTVGDVPKRSYPGELLAAWLPRLGAGQGKRALDLACGGGRNALHLAQAGYEVDAVDISPAALARGRESAAALDEELTIHWLEQDLDTGPLPHSDYAVIVVSRFHSRNSVPWILDALADNGYLIYETHFLTRQPVDGPKSIDFRVRPNELLRLFSPLRVLHYAERIRPEPEGRRMAIAELVACNGDGGM
jgi:SAM-dependent methyltransferase